jgi:hypothetical protein
MHGRFTSLVALLVIAASVSAHAQLVIVVPPAPTNFQATGAGSRGVFNWDAAAPGTGVDGYRLQITPVDHPGPTLIQDTGLTRPVSVSLEDGIYDAFVQAVNTAGASPPSATVRFTIAPTSAPGNFAATVSGNSVNFVWTAPAGDPKPVTYRIEIGIPGDETIQTPTIDVTGAEAGPFSHTLAFGNGVYVARVRGVEADRPGIPTTDITFIIGPPPTGAVPFPPSGLIADIVGTTVTLRWNLRVDSPPASSFVVNAFSDAGVPLANFDTRNPALRVTFPNIPSGSYLVSVSSQNVHGLNQHASTAIFVAVNDGRPSCGAQLEPPTGLSYSQSGNFVALTWARPAVGTSLTGYLIDVVGSLNATFSTGNQSTVVSGSLASGTYGVQVRSHDSCTASTPTNQVVITIP